MSLDDIAALLHRAWIRAKFAASMRPDQAQRAYPWTDLPESERDTWRAVAKAAVDLAPALVRICEHEDERREDLSLMGTVRYRCRKCGRTRAE